ncbi:hypothetical protein V6M85_14000 (plasmid) [Sulfolobus tengchongensis]|uniref:Uncharacterized protein n=1 Tax=Sulfolobus tengchongensis TaxID=207809 RepID=A0AAX4L6J4_9CREN
MKINSKDKEEEEYDYDCINEILKELGIPSYEGDIVFFLVAEKCKKVSGKNAKKK